MPCCLSGLGLPGFQAGPLFEHVRDEWSGGVPSCDAHNTNCSRMTVA